MHRNHWEMEVIAREFQERRWQEAARRRLLDEAARGTPFAATDPFNLSIARFLTAVKARLLPASGAAMPQRVGGAPVSKRDALESGASQGRPGARPAQFAQPYSDMMVIARGPLVGVAEQPSGVSEC